MAFPSHLRYFGSWNYNGDIVICGGYLHSTTDDERDDCFRFKAEEKYSVMHTFPKLLTTLTNFATCVINDVLWLAGGVKERHPSSLVWVLSSATMFFDEIDNIWKYGPNLPAPVMFPAFVAISDTEALIIGGERVVSSAWAAQGAVDRLDTSTNPATIDTSYPNLPVTLKYHSAIKFTKDNQDMVLTVGGANDNASGGGPVYKSILPGGAWNPDGTMVLGTGNFLIMWPFCDRTPITNEIWCVHTKEASGEIGNQVHRFNPDGPPYWSKIPITMETTTHGNNPHTVFYNYEKKVCC